MITTYLFAIAIGMFTCSLMVNSEAYYCAAFIILAIALLSLKIGGKK